MRSQPGVWGQTRLLLRKNWLSKKRQQKKKLFWEFFSPILFLVILTVLVKLDNVRTYPEINTPYETPQNVLSSLSDLTIYVVPDTPHVRATTTRMKVILGRKRPRIQLGFAYLADEEALEEEYKRNDSVDYAIVFGGGNEYTIRTNPDNIPIPKPGDRKEELTTCRQLGEEGQVLKSLESPLTCPVNGFYYYNFLALQALVDQALLENNSNKTLDVEIKMENYPKSAFNPGLSAQLRILIPLYSVIPMVALINSLLVMIVTEKEDKIKDGLRMSSVSDAAYWLSWFIFYSVYIGFFALLFTTVLHFVGVLGNMNILLLFLMFAIFGFSIITFAFFLTPFFHKPKTAGLVGTLILQMSSMLFLLQTYLKNETEFLLIPLRLISSLAFTTAMEEAGALEPFGGLQFSDLTFGGRGQTALISLLFMTFDIFLYAFLAYYLDNVLPNEFGGRNHPLFLFRPGFWTGRSKNGDNLLSSADFESVTEFGDEVEPVPSNMGREAVTIRSLKKEYKGFRSKPVQALGGVSLSIHESQITCLIGKNGAGKSTLMNILAGLVPPSSGNVSIFGLNIKKPEELAKIRREIGVCMQSDLHFPALTVEEHLEFYGKIRGLEGSGLTEEMDGLIHELDLKSRRKVRAEKLSGGEKRKLSIGIALIGSPKMLILDEPTAGIDPVSRRHLWSLLQRVKEGKVIILSSHFMDEADLLGDRKAIIHNGQILAVGSSLFLKNRFGVGYYLTVELKVRDSSSEESDAILNQWIPSALATKKAIGSEIKYSLPHSSISSFPALFSNYEEAMTSPSSTMSSFGVSMTTLEDVFLKITNDIDLNGSPEESSIEESSLVMGEIGPIQPRSLKIAGAMVKLRFLRQIRTPSALFFMVVMPLILVAAGLWISSIDNTGSGVKQVSYGIPSQIYPKSELNLALAGPGNSGGDWEGSGFKIWNYSGVFKDLLEFQKELNSGTLAAINVVEEGDSSLKILLRVNGTYSQSPPLLVNTISRYLASKLGLVGEEIKANYKPFLSKDVKKFNNTSITSIFFLGPVLLFTCVGLVIEIVKDRELKARNHLRVNGLGFYQYFTSMYIVFGAFQILILVMLICLIFAFQVPAFILPYATFTIILLSLLFILPCFLFTTCFSYLFSNVESGQSIFANVSSLSGIIMGIVIMITHGLDNQNIVFGLHTLFSTLNVFYIPFGMFYWTNAVYGPCALRGTCDDLVWGDYLGREFIVMYVTLALQIPIFWAILLAIDVIHDGGNPLDALGIRKTLGLGRIHSSFIEDEEVPDSGGSPRRIRLEDEEDIDVVGERERVKEVMDQEENGPCVIAVQNLRKRFKQKSRLKGKGMFKKVVLRGVNFMVEEGEVFGLLGHNGAGKTTTMKIIIGEERAEGGRVKLCGHEIMSNYSPAFQHLGYCPQHDSLWENISLREHMQVYSVIRGVGSAVQPKLIEHFVNGLRIGEHADKKAGSLSGGTKRKLSYGLSMLGYPKIVLLDEPSTGMDPQSKRFLWNTISGTFKESRGAILTTHAMEEADALCTRIAIMVRGALICVGSPQHLKSKYGAGYSLEVKLKEDSLEEHPLNAFNFVLELFPGAKLTESFGNRAIFALTQVKSISGVFATLEQAKSAHNIEEYSFSQTTLEQVFLSFSKDEEEE